MQQKQDLLKTAGIIGLTTAVGFLFEYYGIHEANIITLYILGVLIISVITSGRWYSLISSIANVFLFNFFFTAPKYTFRIHDSAYFITFFVMFIAACITSSLALKIQNSARQSERTAFRTRLLFETNKLLQQSEKEQDAAEVTARQLAKLLDREVLFYPVKEGSLSVPLVISAEGKETANAGVTEEDRAAAEWVYEHPQKEGAGTNPFFGAACQYFAVRVNDNVYGVVGIAAGKNSPDEFENSMIMSILGECGLAIENLRNIAEKENAAVLAKNEQLRANLLRSISHDLRTPLTSISGNADILISNADVMESEKRMSLYRNIYEDALWLISLVENILSVTRIEDGTMKLHLSSELIEDVIQEAVSHVNKENQHIITVQLADEFLLARMDARLIVQVLVNILDNAMKYTPPGALVKIRAYRSGAWIVVEIADNGNGISDEAKPKIFDMFYTAETKIADSRRSVGLGLAVCKSIVTSHGGSIEVYDNKPSGAVFRFTLPAEEVHLHE